MPCPTFLGRDFGPERRLLADDGDFGGGDFQTHEAVIVVEKEKNFEVGRGDLETFIDLPSAEAEPVDSTVMVPGVSPAG